MMRPILALIVLAAIAGATAAQTPLQRCKVITEAMERLQCYDAIEESPAARPAAPVPAARQAAPGEDPLITQAKESVTSQLRDPSSARFSNVKVRTVRGKQAVCGLFNAKNAAGIMTGPQPFAFDGEKAHLIIYNPGPANNTKMDGYSLTTAMGERLRDYNRLCR
jgi:hypothetical protein